MVLLLKHLEQNGLILDCLHFRHAVCIPWIEMVMLQVLYLKDMSLDALSIARMEQQLQLV